MVDTITEGGRTPTTQPRLGHSQRNERVWNTRSGLEAGITEVAEIDSAENSAEWDNVIKIRVIPLPSGMGI